MFLDPQHARFCSLAALGSVKDAFNEIESTIYRLCSVSVSSLYDIVQLCRGPPRLPTSLSSRSCVRVCALCLCVSLASKLPLVVVFDQLFGACQNQNNKLFSTSFV